MTLLTRLPSALRVVDWWAGASFGDRPPHSALLPVSVIKPALLARPTHAPAVDCEISKVMRTVSVGGQPMARATEYTFATSASVSGVGPALFAASASAARTSPRAARSSRARPATEPRRLSLTSISPNTLTSSPTAISRSASVVTGGPFARRLTVSSSNWNRPSTARMTPSTSYPCRSPTPTRAAPQTLTPVARSTLPPKGCNHAAGFSECASSSTVEVCLERQHASTVVGSLLRRSPDASTIGRTLRRLPMSCEGEPDGGRRVLRSARPDHPDSVHRCSCGGPHRPSYATSARSRRAPSCRSMSCSPPGVTGVTRTGGITTGPCRPSDVTSWRSFRGCGRRNCARTASASVIMSASSYAGRSTSARTACQRVPPTARHAVTRAPRHCGACAFLMAAGSLSCRAPSSANGTATGATMSEPLGPSPSAGRHATRCRC